MGGIDTTEALYEYLGRSKYEWLRTGQQLIFAANLLNSESSKTSEKLYERLEETGTVSDDEFIGARTFIPAKMMTGMAFETLIKGLIIIRKPEFVSKDKKFVLKSHNLLLLWITHLPEIPIADKEKAVLTELENYIAWKGRYPIPLVARNFTPSVVIENETSLINCMYDKLLKEYE